MQLVQAYEDEVTIISTGFLSHTHPYDMYPLNIHNQSQKQYNISGIQ